MIQVYQATPLSAAKVWGSGLRVVLCSWSSSCRQRLPRSPSKRATSTTPSHDRQTKLFHAGQCVWIVNDQVVAMVRRNKHCGFVPIAVCFNPADDCADGFVTAVDRSDRIVEIVGVKPEVNISGLDKQRKRLVSFCCQ